MECVVEKMAMESVYTHLNASDVCCLGSHRSAQL